MVERSNTNEYIAEKFPNLSVEKGCLYIVATPIGNLDDISFRALYVLKNVDYIASEDTRVTGVMLKEYGINAKQISYFAQVESKKLDEIVDKLKEGNSIALVSDAGTPCISDPGAMLVSRCVEEGINVVSIPGASSMVHSLVVSGFDFGRFYFQGFLPQKKGRQGILEELKDVKMPIVIFESKYKIMKTLEDLLKVMGNREVSISRELTKKFEDTTRGRIKDILGLKNNFKLKGEFVIVVN
jgi:16S rRNA (cytidine1402-2'-O)-methyltransferase